MKKTKINLIVTLLISIIYLFSSNNVLAVTQSYELTRTLATDIYYERTKDNYYHSYYYQMYELNDVTAYCIEPGVDITSSEYFGYEDLSLSNLSSEQINNIFLYAYYGYGYNNHDTINYRVATQALIWNEVSDYTVKFNTEMYGYGTYIDYSLEMQEIVNLANSHYIVPSFASTTIDVIAGEETTLIDTNNVLSLYEVYSSNISEISIVDNELTFTSNVTGNISIEFIKYNDTQLSQLIYYDNDSQKMITRSNIDEVKFSIEVNTLGGIVEIYKLDYDTKTNTASGEASLEGAVYGIYDLEDNLVETITTNEYGYAVSTNLPSFNTYYLEEISSPTGYTLNEEKYYIDSNIDNMLVSINVYDKVITKDIEITKVYASDATGILTAEEDAQFNVYDINNNIVFNGVTDSNGKLYFTLPYGSYTVEQISSSYNYEKVDNFSINVTQEEEANYYVIANAQITSYLKITKVDSLTNEVIPLSGFTFKIYNLDTNEYVCQTVSYPTLEYICEYTTDKSGTLITPQALVTGHYLLEEVDTLTEGYLYNTDTITFEIGESTEYSYDENLGLILNIEYPNTEVKGEITVYKEKEIINIYDNEYIYSYEPLEGVVISLFAKEDIYSSSGVLMYEKDALVSSDITSSEGSIIFSNLYLGEYYIKEISTSNIYLLDETKYEVNLSYIDQYTDIIYEELTITNYLKTGSIELIKVDSNTLSGIYNTEFSLYNANDELIYIGYTDINGYLIINDLPIGNYYIIETNSSKGYINTNEIYYIDITDNKDVIELIVENDNITINEVPNTYKDISYSSSLFIFFIYIMYNACNRKKYI